MPTRSNAATLEGNLVHLRPPRRRDAKAFIAHAARSRMLHRRWVQPPDTPEAFATYVQRFGKIDQAARNVGFLIVRNDDDTLAGVVNLSEIIRGAFQSAYVGYYAFTPSAGHGYISEGLALALDFAFGELALHRIEANVQPANDRSLALIERIGFVREGYSSRYVKIAGRWRDHVRFAMLAEEWIAHRSRLRRHLPRAACD